MKNVTKTIAKSIVYSLGFVLFLSGCKSSETATKPSTPSATSRTAAAPKSGIKKFSDVIKKDAVSDEGVFTVHKQEDKYYFEIPNDALSKEMLLVTRVAGTTQNLSFGGAGQKVRGQQVVRWERNGDNILFRHVSTSSVADLEDPVYNSVKNNNFEPVVFSFPIEALSKDSSGVVIEVSKLYTTDVALLGGLNDGQRRAFQVRRLDGSRTFIQRMASYPENLEVRHVLTYDAGNAPDNGQTNTISLEVNQSMIMLPEEKAMPRKRDNRVGYFSVSQTNYSSEAHRADRNTFITRWKLVPKDKEAYLRGELVEPEEPIVYYVDPATPMKWRKYIAQGVDDWAVAFEAAGFKNAIYSKMPPTADEDPEFSPEDVRYSVIRYITTTIQNAQGPHVHDPRSGQILESDILWYHNIMNLLRNWYFVQTAASNPEARTTRVSDEIMGELIRFVSAHEVGHTLGLPHNMGSSAAFPVDSLRSPTFTANRGTAPSIMDYARFNYIAQPGDGVTQYYPQIGEYDKWSIKWGYTWFPDIETPSDEDEILNEWIVERADDPVYFYGRQRGVVDPRAQTEDLGDDAMRASELGLANLQVITENLVGWIEEEGENYDELAELYGNIIGQWRRYMGHVSGNVGGVYETFKTFEQGDNVYHPVEKEKQKRAIAFLNQHAWSTPTWAFNRDILSRINESSAIETFRGAQAGVLSGIMSPARLGRVIDSETRTDNPYTIIELMDDVRNGIFSEVRSTRNVDVHRRYLQRAYIDQMENLMTSDGGGFFGGGVNVSQSDIRPIVRNQLVILDRDITRALNAGGFDRSTRVHLEDAKERVSNILDPK